MGLVRGDRVDRYTLVEPIGEGGQARVWRVIDALEPEQPRVAKLVDLSLSSAEAAERVRREARQLVQLRHPSLVCCHALFEDVRAQILGVVMDYVQGSTISTALTDERFGDRQRLAALRRVASVLAYLHEHGVVHRDLKPDNVILTQDFWRNPADAANVKLVDFGIAAPTGNPTPLTQIGNIVGTPAFMAPEALDSMFWLASATAPAVDVYAFGMLTWILLVGGHPTGLPDDAEPVAYAWEYRRLASAASWPRSVPRGGWSNVLHRALQLRAASRIGDGRELERVIAEEESRSSEPVGTTGRAAQTSHETPAPFAVGTETYTSVTRPPETCTEQSPPYVRPRGDVRGALEVRRARSHSAAWMFVVVGLGLGVVIAAALGIASWRQLGGVSNAQLSQSSSAVDSAAPSAPPTTTTTDESAKRELERAKREAAAAKKRAEEAERRAAAAERARMLSEAPGKVTATKSGCRCARGLRIVVDCAVTNPSPIPVYVRLRASAETSVWGMNSSGATSVVVPADTASKPVSIDTSFNGLVNCGRAINCKCEKVSAIPIASSPDAGESASE